MLAYEFYHRGFITAVTLSVSEFLGVQHEFCFATQHVVMLNLVS